MKTKNNKVAVALVSGNINGANGSGKAYLFHSPTMGSLREGGKETYLSNAIQEAPDLATKGLSARFPARNNIRDEIGGTVYQHNYLLAEGEVFKIFASTNAAGDWNARQKTACLLFSPRKEGTLYRVDIRVPCGVEDSTFEVWTLTGRFDIVSLEDAELRGLNVLENARYQFAPASVDKLFVKNVLDNELKALPKIEAKKVGDRVMRTSTRRRMLDI